MSKSIEFVVDHEKRRVIRTVRGAADSDEIGEELLAIIDANPDTMSYDAITDWRDYTGKIEWRDLSAFAKSFAERYQRYLAQPGADRRKVRSAFVIEDRMAPTLVSAMQHLYDNRALRVFSTLEQATAWLDGNEAAGAVP
jgi:hypothetical protein